MAGRENAVASEESQLAHDPRNVEILRRLKSVEGHVRGVGRMVEADAYCMDVLNQLLAVQRALKKVSGLVLDRHLHHCVTRAIRGDDPDERERVIAEVMEAFHATGRS
jgi:DNA-binding FrmR family transcriptional regulator